MAETRVKTAANAVIITCRKLLEMKSTVLMLQSCATVASNYTVGQTIKITTIFVFQLPCNAIWQRHV